jgi:hypothetical protein
VTVSRGFKALDFLVLLRQGKRTFIEIAVSQGFKALIQPEAGPPLADLLLFVSRQKVMQIKPLEELRTAVKPAG